MDTVKPKVGVYIDGANLYHGAKDAGWQISYKNLKDFVARKYSISIISYYSCYGYEKGDDGKPIKDAYGQYKPDPGTTKFFNFLKGQGIRVETKPLKYINGDINKAANKMDGDLMLAAFEENPQWDEMILFAGDCDYERLVKNMIKLSKPVHVFSFANRLSRELKELAFNSAFVDFTEIDKLKGILEFTKEA